GFAIGNQVVHDQVGMALIAPAGLIFAHAMLQIERREALVGVLIIIRGRIDEAAAGRAAGSGEVEDLPQLAMGHVLEGIKVLILGGDFDAAAPAAGAVEVQAAGVWNLGAIDNELVVVETFVLGPRVADPGAVLALGQGVFYATQIEH